MFEADVSLYGCTVVKLAQFVLKQHSFLMIFAFFGDEVLFCEMMVCKLCGKLWSCSCISQEISWDDRLWNDLSVKCDVESWSAQWLVVFEQHCHLDTIDSMASRLSLEVHTFDFQVDWESWKNDHTVFINSQSLLLMFIYEDYKNNVPWDVQKVNWACLGIKWRREAETVRHVRNVRWGICWIVGWRRCQGTFPRCLLLW